MILIEIAKETAWKLLGNGQARAGHQLFAMKIVDEDRLVNAQALGWNKHY